MKKLEPSINFHRWLLTFFMFTSLSLFAQEQERSKTAFCYTDEMLSKSLKENPELIDQLNNQEKEIINYRKNIINNTLNELPESVGSGGGNINYIVPVVVYIVHQNGIGDITDLQVTSQIDKLNDEFSGHGINFCLATTEGTTNLPGTTANPGIVRINSSLTNHLTSNEAALKALSPLPSDRYLRIWVVNNINNGIGILGYSSIIGGASLLDGIVMRNDAFGDVATCGCTNLLPSNNQGKVLVHEVGHYFNLYHTFQGGCSGMNTTTCDSEGDYVCDTPPVAANNSGCPALGSVNSCHELPDLPDLLDNHMDYTNDNCRTSFTNGQETRMICSINLSRSMLVSSPNLLYTGIQCNGGLFAIFEVGDAPCNNSPLSFGAAAVSGASYSWDFGDGSSTYTGQSGNHVYSTGGMAYTITLTVTIGNNSVSQSQQVYVTDCSPINSSQGNWYFYDRAGLDFSSGAPVADDAAWDNSTISGMSVGPGLAGLGEACADQSDDNGNLLFYTDAVHVWDSTHALINAGNDLFGHNSCATGTIIVPDPGNSSQYYIFTTSTFSGFGNNPNFMKGFRYSKVETAGFTASMTNTVNVAIPAPAGYSTGQNGALFVGESITAIASCNGYWIICNAEKAGSRYLVVYELTSSGLVYHSEYNCSISTEYANLEAAPNGNIVAVTQFAQNTSFSYVYNFDKIAGVFTSETNVNSFSARGVSFSPNSQLLYLIGLQPISLYQYDMTAININSSEIVVSSSGDMFSLQIGPDNKVYVGLNHATKLGVIHTPNTLSTSTVPNACFYSLNGPSLNTVASGIAIKSSIGLPNMVDANTTSVFSNAINANLISCLSYQFSIDVCGTSFNWDFGDPGSPGNLTSSPTPIHTFSSPGTYTVEVEDVNGTIFTKIVEVGFNTIINGPYCADSNTIYNYSATGAPAGSTYLWSTSAGGAITGQNGVNNVDITWSIFPSMLTLIVSDPSTGCTDTSTFTIFRCSDDCDITPGFNYEISGCDYYFNDISFSAGFVNITSWDWNFGDSQAAPGQNTATGTNPMHSFSVNGTYTVYLTVTGNNGIFSCQETISHDIVVADCAPVNCILNSTFTGSTLIDGGCTYNFVNTTVTPSGINITGWVWKVNGTIVSNNSNMNYTFPASGSYSVCLTTYGFNGVDSCYDEICQTVEIESNCGPVNCILNSTFTGSTLTDGGCTYNFVNSTITPPGININSWEWKVNGIVVSNNSNMNYTFPANGLYNVCLRVYGDNGYVSCYDETCQTVVIGSNCGPVNCILNSTFTGSTLTDGGCTYNFVNSTITPPGININSWEWKVNGIVVSNSSNMSYIFPTSGVYNVCLRVYGDNGYVSCYDETCQTIIIESNCGPAPCVIAPVFQSISADGCTFSFVNSTITPSGININSWEWKVNGTLVSNNSNMSYTFSNSGMYNVCLTAYGDNGYISCYATSCSGINIGGGCPEHHESALKVWPNPSNGLYYLDVKIEEFNTDNIKIYNAIGNEISFKRGMQDGFPYIKLGETNKAGMYFLLLQADNKIIKARLIKF